MRGNHHSITQAAAAKSGFQARFTFVTVVRIIRGRTDRRSGFPACRSVAPDTPVCDLRTSIHNLGHRPSSGVGEQFRFVEDWHLRIFLMMYSGQSLVREPSV